MPAGHGERYDFFLSRRGSVAAIAREVADVLTEKGYRVLVQDYDIPLGSSFVEAMHEAVKNSRDLVILFTHDYEQSPYTRKEFTSFEAERAQSAEERHIVVMRCEDVPLRGLLADNVYQDLVGVTDPKERKRRIIAAAERQSQAAPPPPRPFVGVPPRIASFTGRTEELDRLDAILMHDKPAAVTQAVGRAAVQGLGGVGKTALAVEYAHCYRKLYAGVYWCPAETRAGLLRSLAALAVMLGAATAEEAEVEEAAKAAMRHLAEQRATWLLVYDNVTSPDEISDLLPSGGARVLITSRFSDWAEWAEEVALDVLPLEQAAAFVQSRSGRSDAVGARTLAETLGSLPLALDHAAAYCKATQMPFADYAENASGLIAAAPRAAGYPRSVAATFQLAVTQAIKRCAQAEALMAYLAQCSPERIPMVLVEGEDETARHEAVAALAEVSLIKHDPFEDGTPAITVHRLLQVVVRTRAEADGIAGPALERLIDRLVSLFPQEYDAYRDPTFWPLCDRLMPHLLALTSKRSVTLKPAETSELLNRAGIYLLGRASHKEAENLLREALRIREQALGAEHDDTAESLNSVAALLREQGEYPEARPLFRRALAIREKALGPDHPDTAMIINNLAAVLQDEGDFRSAEALYERALAIREKTLGPDHPDTAGSLTNLASVSQAQWGLSKAQLLYERALAIYRKVRGDQHLDTAMGLDNLAVVLRAQRRYSEARPLSEQALAIREKVLGNNHPQTAQSLNNLALLLWDQDSLSRARSMFERALVISEQVFGPQHPNTLAVRQNLSELPLPSLTTRWLSWWRGLRPRSSLQPTSRLIKHSWPRRKL
jgi:tetratricopeptide (TPR) repeat protein